ncbi:hypothetical protein NCC78_23550 [Micromonospora phytophila]|uniref:hypothetical protein n=1 Tax=Micromonospora phytophila TaxID=709888 RepID=UPI00202F09B5|nr:hypothetical protein [Micromonospora phytophila]MCM0677639.1 hypothetical protein [Micromonospora phytophila]
MELHRNRGALVLPLVCVLGGVVLLALPGQDAVLRRLVAVGAVLLGGAVLVSLLRPFRFGISADGLTVRRPGLRRVIPWQEVAALALDQPPALQGRPSTPRLLLVPAPGTMIDVPADAHHPVDGRAAVELLDLERVREKPDEVAAALARYAGDRFVDVLGRRRAAFAADDFAVGLRGYRAERVDELIRRGRDALVWGGALERQAARSEIERARAEGLPIEGRGYSRLQVDEALAALSGALADDRSTDRHPTP